MTTEIQIATGSAIARAARLAWETDGKDGEPEIPTERDLAEWIDQIPRKYLEDADGKLLEMMAKVGEPIGGEHGIPMLLRQAIWTTSGGELLAELLYGGYREVVDGDTAPREAVDEELTAFLMWIDLLERGDGRDVLPRGLAAHLDQARGRARDIRLDSNRQPSGTPGAGLAGQTRPGETEQTARPDTAVTPRPGGPHGQPRRQAIRIRSAHEGRPARPARIQRGRDASQSSPAPGAVRPWPGASADARARCAPRLAPVRE